MKFSFEGFEVSEQSTTKEKHHFDDKFDISFNEHFDPKDVIAVSGGHGIAPRNEKVLIVKVPAIQ